MLYIYAIYIYTMHGKALALSTHPWCLAERRLPAVHLLPVQPITIELIVSICFAASAVQPAGQPVPRRGLDIGQECHLAALPARRSEQGAILGTAFLQGPAAFHHGRFEPECSAPTGMRNISDIIYD